MQLSTKTKIGMGIFSFAVVAFSALEIYGVTEHLKDATWPAHAKFHAITGLFDELTLCIFTLVLTWRFLKQGQRWAWGALAVIGFAVFGGLLIGDPLSGGGLSGGGESLGNPKLFTGLAWLSVVLWVIALGLTRSHVEHQGSNS